MVKKLILSISACLLGSAIMVQAAPANEQQKSFDKNQLPHRKAMNAFAEKLQGKAQVATRADFTEVISNPQGEYKFYNKDVYGYLLNELGNAPVGNATFATHVVFGDNNEVYFYDLISNYVEDSYIKGTIENNVITVTFPQTITILYYGGFESIVNAYLYQNDGTNRYNISDTQTVTFTYNPTTEGITLNMPGSTRDYLIGYAAIIGDDREWLGFGDFTQTYTLNTEVNTIPDGVVMEDYVIKLSDYGYPVEVGMDSENIYIRNIIQDGHGSVLIGKLNGNTATITSKQTVGNVYYFWAQNSNYVESNDQLYAAPDNTVYTLTIDTQNKVITTVDQQLIDGLTPYLGFANFTENMNFVIFDEFTINQQDSFSGIPSDPKNLHYDSLYAGYYKIPYIDVTLPNLSTTGNVLDMDNLYFKIYVDGQLYTFTPSASSAATQYDGLPPGGSTEIPVWLNNSSDIITLSPPVDHIIGVYTSGCQTIGVQLIYYYDNIITESGIVTLNLNNGTVTTTPSSGIEGVEVSDVISETYYDLNGRRVYTPEKGIYIKRTVLSDGTIKAVKVIK